ncbi:hypothetical protein RHMOL_Rhmol06G0063000 [Rhododendron molle]|uniref:Uncharacterized protein n=1 Tax=Rhododendron molle TaxID=49168 RepID=A0ACC0NAW1_RHOML|nr:hypothetical protein RHMOL_Rhmol06G0063000 [Rhododendron molle]
MQSPPPVTPATLTTGISSENITTEEEDHLVRSTKKIKNDHNTASDMEDIVSSPTNEARTDIEMANGAEIREIQDPPKEPTKSFKQILINSRVREVAFSDDVETIPFDEEAMGEDEEIDGIPVVNFPKSLIKYDRGKYARVCVEIDLNKPLKSRIYIEGKIYRIEYEHIPIMCFGCGRVGHRRDQCSWGNKPVSTPVPEINSLLVTASSSGTVEKMTNHPPGQNHNSTGARQPAYGHWTLVQKKPHRPIPGRRFTDKTYIAQTNRNSGPNSQRNEPRENRYSLLNWLDASSSGTKRGAPQQKPNRDPKPSQSVLANKPSQSVLDSNPTKPSQVLANKPSQSVLDSNPTKPSPVLTSNIVSLTLENDKSPDQRPPNSDKPKPIIPPSDPSPPQLSTLSQPVCPSKPPVPPITQQTPIQDESQTNRDLPPPKSSDLHPNQTRRRQRSSGDNRLVHPEDETGGDNARAQRSWSPVLRGGLGESERGLPRSDHGQANGGLE